LTQLSDQATYKTKLLTLRTALLAQIADQRGGTRGRADVAAEKFQLAEDSSAQMASARELEFAISEHEIVELQALDDALHRLDIGSYGLCTDCDTLIPQDRLSAMPEAPRCMPCQNKAELLLN
jgi:DnaK suppressor protein